MSRDRPTLAQMRKRKSDRKGYTLGPSSDGGHIVELVSLVATIRREDREDA